MDKNRKVNRRQIVNRYVQHILGVKGPYANNIGGGKYARAVTRKTKKTP